MPVKKTQTKTSSHDCCFSGACTNGLVRKAYLEEFGHKIIWTLVGVALLYLTIFLGTLIQKNLKETHYVGKAEPHERTITIEADATIAVQPDVAITSMGVISEADSVDVAQAENTQVMNRLIQKLRDLGIATEDIQTSQYTVYPRYDYTEEGQTLRGYQVSQQVRIKIRDVGKANDVIALAGPVGANVLSGIEFTVDDTDVYMQRARQEALQKVGAKAADIASQIGVSLVRVVGYDEFINSGVYPQTFRAESAIGIGGGAAPDIQPGSEEVQLGVRVTFEIE